MRLRVHRRQRQQGMSLPEVVITAAILVVLAAAVIPTVMSRLDASRAASLVTEVAGLNKSLQTFRKDVGSYPRFLSYLTALPASNQETYCSTGLPFGTLIVFLGPQLAAWQGPYSTRAITGDYTTSEGYTVENLMSYTAPSGSVPAYLIIKINDISSGVAQFMDDAIDGPGNGFATGMFTWDGVNGSYRIPVPTCP
jgi:prepilin-type N-terminal cleavage/methylation domain-containing protein